MAETEKKWYVLRAISGRENKVKEYLDMDLKNNPTLQSLISQVLIPTEKVYQLRKDGKKVIKEKTYLPGYVLVEANLTGEAKGYVRNIPNVLGFLGEKDGQAIPLRPAEVNRILGTIDQLTEDEGEFVTPYFVGDTVKIISGPFNGFSAIIEEVNNEKKKLKVMVMIFGGRKTLVELSFMQVEKEH